MAAKGNGSGTAIDAPRQVIDAAMELAAAGSWHGLSMDDIIDASKLPRAEVQRYFLAKHEILIALARQTDADVLSGDLSDLADETPRDALFDILMQRFDALDAYKPGLKVVLGEARSRPQHILPVLPQLGRSMAAMMTAVGIDPKTNGGPPRVAALSLIWLSVMRKWLDDDSADQAKTMAALDKALLNAESLANSLNDGPVSFIRTLLSELRSSRGGDKPVAPSD